MESERKQISFSHQITITEMDVHHQIHLLSTLLSDSEHPNPIVSLADSDQPARSLLTSSAVYVAVSSTITISPTSGAGDDPICRWLYDTYIAYDHDLHLVVLSFIPLIAGIYLSRVHSLSSSAQPVAGFEAVLLAIHSLETKSRAGKPILISIPDLSHSSPYHTPSVYNNNQNPSSQSHITEKVIGIISPPLEPQTDIKSTKRATIVGAVLDCYYKQISEMPDWSKLDFCKFVADWSGQSCPCKSEFDQKLEITVISDGISTNEIEIEGSVLGQMKESEINDGNPDNVFAGGTRIPLPWELLQPVLRILAHCLWAPIVGNDVKDASSRAARFLYARSSHDLVPRAILATRALIQLNKRDREDAAITAVANTVGSNPNSPTKAKKPEIHVV